MQWLAWGGGVCFRSHILTTSSHILIIAHTLCLEFKLPDGPILLLFLTEQVYLNISIHLWLCAWPVAVALGLQTIDGNMERYLILCKIYGLMKCIIVHAQQL